jgi:hypothetical protein
VKDFQQLINLKAICKNPQMQVSGVSLVFVAQVSWKQDNNNVNNNKVQLLFCVVSKVV